MYKPSTHLVITYFLPIYIYMITYFVQNWFPRWNQILTQLRFIHNWVQLSNKGMHPVDGALVGAVALLKQPKFFWIFTMVSVYVLVHHGSPNWDHFYK